MSPATRTIQNVRNGSPDKTPNPPKHAPPPERSPLNPTIGSPRSLLSLDFIPIYRLCQNGAVYQNLTSHHAAVFLLFARIYRHVGRKVSSGRLLGTSRASSLGRGSREDHHHGSPLGITRRPDHDLGEPQARETARRLVSRDFVLECVVA